MENYIALALSLIAVILCIVILSKVSKILDNLHTPIVKKARRPWQQGQSQQGSSE